MWIDWSKVLKVLNKFWVIQKISLECLICKKFVENQFINKSLAIRKHFPANKWKEEINSKKLDRNNFQSKVYWIYSYKSKLHQINCTLLSYLRCYGHFYTTCDFSSYFTRTQSKDNGNYFPAAFSKYFFI